MNLSWIFPKNKMCGISMYSHKCLEALDKHGGMEIIEIDPEEFLNNPKDTRHRLRQCQLFHIQYETSFFLKNNRDRYFDVCATVRCPIIVTLHEVYDRFPGVFPRESITGIAPLRYVKQIIYDFRHPYIAGFRRHVRRGFCARLILVHAEFQRQILVEKGVGQSMLAVLPFPVQPVNVPADALGWNPALIRCAATGFINDSYDYDLLMNVLDQWNMPWKFTWIGGVRRPEDEPLMARLKAEIVRRNWADRFIITGRISEKQRDETLAATQIYLAFFKYKSSSESLSTAIGANVAIVATSIPLTREIASGIPCMLVVPPIVSEIVDALRHLVKEESVRSSLKNALAKYREQNSYERMAQRLASQYERVLGS